MNRAKVDFKKIWIMLKILVKTILWLISYSYPSELTLSEAHSEPCKY